MLSCNNTQAFFDFAKSSGFVMFYEESMCMARDTLALFTNYSKSPIPTNVEDEIQQLPLAMTIQSN